jgi:hypothetical protein
VVCDASRASVGLFRVPVSDSTAPFAWIARAFPLTVAAASIEDSTATQLTVAARISRVERFSILFCITTSGVGLSVGVAACLALLRVEAESG